MSKVAENNVSYLKRGNLHSTKPFKTGNNEHLATRHYDVQYSAENIAKEEVELQRLEDRRTQLIAKAQAIEELLRPLSLKLQQTMPLEEFKKVKAQRALYANEKYELQKELSEIKKQRSGLPRYQIGGFNDMFHTLAKETLPRDVYHELILAVKKYFKENP